MADKLNASTAKSGLDKAALKRCVTDINRHKEKAAEYVGLAGKATSNAVETYNFDKKALTFCAQLMRKEPEQQLAALGAIITYAEALGMFSQMDLFNDAIGAMKSVIESAEKGSKSRPAGAATVAALSAVN
jgi:hypothetical protein